MVYGGKPSTGCQNCRNRHIKCDETRPDCRACVRTGRVCPGYPHPLDFRLRDRTAFQRKKRSVSTVTPSTQESSTPADKNGSLAPSSSSPSPISIFPAAASVTAWPARVPDSLYLPLEDTVTSLFFNSYLYLPKDPLIRNGFMELLPQSYARARSGSHLHLGALAVSFFSVAAWTGQRSLLRSAEQFFMSALSRTRIALQGDLTVNLDETLMAVLLLSVYEEFVAIKEQRTPTKAHVQGAIALVNSQRLERDDSPVARTLTNAVQVQAIKGAMGLSYPMVRTPDIWPILPPIPEAASSSQLTIASSELVRLRREWEKLLSKPQPPTPDEIASILDTANTLDTRMRAWADFVPPRWKPAPATTIPSAVRAAGIFSDRCDCYPDLWIASTWNFYRDTRIVILNIIRHCLRLLPCPSASASASASTRSEEITTASLQIQSLATDICASVPFFLGSQMTSVQMNTGSSSLIEYPESVGTVVSAAHRQTAPLLGGWFVVTYLANLCEAELELREEQLGWIRWQRMRILRIYTFDW